MEIENDLSTSVDRLSADRERRGVALVLLLIAAFALGYVLKSVITGEPITDYLPMLVASVVAPLVIVFALLAEAGTDEDV